MGMLRRVASHDRKRFRRACATLLVVGVLMGALLAAAGPAAADYGPSEVYQVEISANAPGPDGGGVWLWIGLNQNGTGDYAGSDCGHGFGAIADKGDVTWTVANGMLVISGAALFGGAFPVTITVPATYGHYAYQNNPFPTLFGLPFPGGFAQVQVAP